MKHTNFDAFNRLTMSAINLATLSQNLNIATLEELHVYTGFLLNRVNPTLQVLETPTQVQYACQFNIFQVADGTHRVLTRTSLAIDPDWTSDKTQKLWKFVNQLSDVQIPASFLSN